MDDLQRLIKVEDKKNPGFREQVEKRSREIEIAQKLRTQRETLNLTQKEVAKKWKISQQAISRIENARDYHISLHTLIRYANILGYDLKMELVNRQITMIG